MAATRPVTDLASMAIRSISGVAPLKMRTLSYYFLCLTLGPLLGSFITEPAAMAVTALLLSPVAFATPATHRLRYMTLALLFVNVSIGGTLTHFAAPPVVMVADTWRWDFGFMMANFGWKSALAVLINGILGSVIALNELSGVDVPQAPKDQKPVPLWITAVSLVFLGLVVRYHAHIAFFVPLFLMFVGWHQVTSLHQEPLKLLEALLVGFFLGGLVTLVDFQRWWLEPLITSLSSGGLFLGATGLTAITDNAALTYLGSLVSGLSDASKYALVAGAVSGGGLTVIANAPNPVGIGLLKDFFSDRTVSARLLFLYALVPTSVAMICLWIL